MRMLQYAVAAFFLLPSSVVVFGREWVRALRTGPWYFFGQVVKLGPQRVLKRGVIFNVCVFYPMRAGIEIVRRRSLSFPFRAAAALLLRRLRGERDDAVSPEDMTEMRGAGPLPPLPVAALVRMVARPEVQIVSLDIFDTLLTRPVISDPRDIFHLVAERVNGRFGVDFVALRWSAEAEMGDRYATLDAIYAHIARRHSLAENVVQALKEEELRCERALLRPRPDMLEVCRAAARAGKRLVAVSDMYLPSAFLLDILHEKGFSDVAQVYVSAEHKARKTDDGALFGVMLKAEGCAPSAVLHLGDDRQGDVAEPLRRGLAAVHVPSVRQMMQERGGSLAGAISLAAQASPVWGLLLGHALERILDRPEDAPDTLERCDAALFARLALGPLVTSLCLQARATAEREGCARIYYASRDGWLPSLVHNCLQEYSGGPEGVYFQAGRRAYFPFLASSFVEYARTRKLADNLDLFTLEDLLRGHFGDEAESLLQNLSRDERAVPFCKERRRALRLLERLAAPLEKLMEARRKRARLYYDAVFATDEPRLLVFDIGYSGSVATALKAITGKAVDKLYCWQNESGRAADRQQDSRTFLLVGGEDYSPFHLVLEEVFAPCEGGAIDFDSQGRPLLEPFTASDAMRRTLDTMQSEALAFARDAALRFGEYTPLLSAGKPAGVLELFRQWFQRYPLDNRAVFRHVIFPDPVYSDRPRSLEEKLDARLPHTSVFTATGFEDPAGSLMPASLCTAGKVPRLGIHMHIYNVLLAQEFARYAALFPVPFDLFVTSPHRDSIPVLHTLFNTDVLPHARRVIVRQTPNRGRDVAPWLVGLGDEQLACDLVCHVHAKESPQMGFGEAWRSYLLDNLLRPDAVHAALAAFDRDARLGCLFPAMFVPLRRVMKRVGVPLYGSEEERDMITGLLARMNLPAAYGRSEQFFSGGTMMWFRTQALRPLLECGLRFEDFPEEPVGVGGTLAHALERVPPLVCTRCGYSVHSLTSYSSSLYMRRRG